MISATGLILRRGHELERVLLVTTQIGGGLALTDGAVGWAKAHRAVPTIFFLLNHRARGRFCSLLSQLRRQVALPPTRPRLFRHRTRCPRRPPMLYHHRVEPTAERAKLGMRADHLEIAARVHAIEPALAGIADHRDHLPPAARLASAISRGNSASRCRGADAPVEIDRVLDREAIGRPRPIGAGIAAAGDATIDYGDEGGIATVDQRALPRAGRRRLSLFRRHPRWSRRRLCLCRRLPAAAGLPLHGRELDLSRSRVPPPRHRLVAAGAADRRMRGARLPPDDRGDRRFANAGSIGVHTRGGFKMIGTHPNVGLKFGRWLDTVMMQRDLGEGASTVPK